MESYNAAKQWAGSVGDVLLQAQVALLAVAVPYWAHAAAAELCARKFVLSPQPMSVHSIRKEQVKALQDLQGSLGAVIKIEEQYQEIFDNFDQHAGICFGFRLIVSCRRSFRVCVLHTFVKANTSTCPHWAMCFTVTCS